jgi:hypothetical protein
MPQGLATYALLPGQPMNPMGMLPIGQTDLVFHDIFEILGTETVGSRKEFEVDPEVLPNEPFDWQVGYFYLYNGEGSAGAPSGSWQFQVFSDWGDGLGLTWRQAAKALDISSYFGGGHRLVKPHMESVALIAWSNAAVDGGIKYGLVCASPPNGPATLVAGLTGNIMFY